MRRAADVEAEVKAVGRVLDCGERGGSMDPRLTGSDLEFLGGAQWALAWVLGWSEDRPRDGRGIADNAYTEAVLAEVRERLR